MLTETNPRRDFLRLAGAGIAGAALAVLANRNVRARRSPHCRKLRRQIVRRHRRRKNARHRRHQQGHRRSRGRWRRNRALPRRQLSFLLDPSEEQHHAPPGTGRHDHRGRPARRGRRPADTISPSPIQWDMYQDFGHSHFHNSLIWGEAIENVSIEGSGRIWGKGLSRGQGAQIPGVGNKSISLKNCHNVLLRDFSIFHGGHFGILATGNR